MLKLKRMRFRKTRENLSILILGFVIICLLFGIVCKEQSLFASAVSVESTESEELVEHHITIHDGSMSFTVRSDARTVEDALKRADIKISEHDTVEPDLSDVIKEDDFNINIYRAREVIVKDGHLKKYIKTAKVDPIEVAEDAGVSMLDADVVKIVTENNILESGMNTVYNIVRAKTVNLDFFGKATTIRTQADTVADFLKEQKISLDDSKVWSSLDKKQKISDGVSLAVYHQGIQTITVEEVIPFGESSTLDFALDYNTRTVTVPGENGQKVATYKVNMKDGQVISREFISEVVTKNPVTQQVLIGMKLNLPAGTHQDWMAAAGISASDYGYVNFIVDHESHWNPIAKNRSSGATGLCQALPGSKMASAGADWETNPITQLRWCNGYAVGRYGSWAAAYEFWQRKHWW